MNEENTALKINIEKHLSELNELRNREDILSHQFEVMKGDRDGKAVQIEQLLGESSQFVIEKEKVLHELTNVTTDRDHLKERIVALSSELNEGRVRINELEVMIDELKDVAKRVKEMSEQPEKYREILSNVSKDCSAIEMDADEIESIEDSTATDPNQTKDPEKESGNSLLLAEQIPLEARRLNDTIGELENRIKTLMDEKEVILSQMGMLKTENKNLNASLEQKMNDRAEEEILQAKQGIHISFCFNSSIKRAYIFLKL